MKLSRIFLACLVACAVLAAPAYPNTGNGLYEPFPSPSSEELAHGFVDALPGSANFTDLSGLDLRRGAFLNRPALAAYAAHPAPAQRAQGGTGFAPSLGWPLALLLLAAVAGGAGVLAVRRA